MDEASLTAMSRQELLSLASKLGVLLNEHETADDESLRELIRRQALP
jgi:hypothetical protein